LESNWWILFGIVEFNQILNDTSYNSPSTYGFGGAKSHSYFYFPNGLKKMDIKQFMKLEIL
jgi:hypothetical protein